MGHGRGAGDGGGEADTATNVAAGSGVAICLVVCFFCVGIPTIFVGAILVAIFDGTLFSVGIACIVLSLLFLVAGVVLVVGICTNCFGTGDQNRVGNGGVIHPGGTTVVMSQQHNTAQMQHPPPYSSDQPPAYHPAPGYSGQPAQSAPYPPPNPDIKY